MKFKAITQPESFFWFEGFKKRSGGARVEIVHDDLYLFSIWVVDVSQFLHDHRPIFPRTMVSNFVVSCAR
jgi:hypothetical protein